MLPPADTNQDAPRLIVRHFRKSDAPQDYDNVIKLRLDVFVDEQSIPIEEELDEYDDSAIHWLISDEVSGDLMATGRLIEYQEGCQARPVAKIGRIAVAKNARGQKLGERVMREILHYAQTSGYEQAILDAQTHAIPFYEKLGFIAEGFAFEEVGIQHRLMRRVF